MERTFLTVTDLEEFIGNYAQNHLNQTVPKIDIRGEHAGKQILKADLEVFMIPISEFRMNTYIIRGRFQKNLPTLQLFRRSGGKLCLQQPFIVSFSRHMKCLLPLFCCFITAKSYRSSVISNSKNSFYFTYVLQYRHSYEQVIKE